jgi:hypothetical protein
MKLYFIIEGEIKMFHGKQKLKQFMTIKLVQILIEMLFSEQESNCNHEIRKE